MTQQKTVSSAGREQKNDDINKAVVNNDLTDPSSHTLAQTLVLTCGKKTQPELKKKKATKTQQLQKTQYR